MKLISLNLGGGERLPALTDFLNMHKDRTDIFCFQQAGSPEQMSEVLSDFNLFEMNGVAVFVRSDYTVQNHDEIPVRNGAQVVLDIFKNEKKYRVINEQGLANSEPIIKAMEATASPVIVTGDFNLENSGLVSLVDEYGIASTRTELYAESDQIVDFLFISPKIKVRGFSVPNMAISTHRPLIFEAK